jgi:hypothetical protein
MKWTGLFLITLFLSVAKASFENQGSGASNIGLSLSGLASRYPDFSVFTNPSLISGEALVDLFYRNLYGIKELNQISINSEFSISNQPLGIGIMRYGNSIYSETKLALGTSYAIDPTFSLGISIKGYFLQIKNYGDAFSLGFSFSVFYKINDQLQIAAVINDLNEPEIGSSGEKIPVSGILGLSFSPVSDVEILMDAYKEEFFNFAYRFGTRINIISNINLLAGFQDNINSFSAGLELDQTGYAIKYSVDIHPVLNASHALGFKYAF